MPLYEYECGACHRRTEKIQKFSDAELTVCPFCGGPLARTITAPAIQFKGAGWYKDLYSSAKPTPSGGAGEAGAASGSSGDGGSGGKDSASGKDGAGGKDSAGGKDNASNSTGAGGGQKAASSSDGASTSPSAPTAPAAPASRGVTP